MRAQKSDDEFVFCFAQFVSLVKGFESQVLGPLIDLRASAVLKQFFVQFVMRQASGSRHRIQMHEMFVDCMIAVLEKDNSAVKLCLKKKKEQVDSSATSEDIELMAKEMSAKFFQHYTCSALKDDHIHASGDNVIEKTSDYFKSFRQDKL